MYTPQDNSSFKNINPLRAAGGKILGYASIVLGAISIIVGLVPLINFLAILVGVIGIVLGIIATRQSMKSRSSSKYGITGIVLSIIGVIISLAINNYVFDKISGEDDRRPATENAADY